MANTQSAVALLSIRPNYAEAILNGEKRVEFRKSGFTRNVTHVVIYATKPVGAVIGVFETDEIVSKSPPDLWDEFSEIGGIGRSDFYDYYSGRNIGFAIKIKCVKRLPSPVPLKRLRLNRPPQSFSYLARTIFDSL